MGLFSNNKKPCPICGNATPRLLPTKVEGVPICKECDKKIDLPNGVLDSMTLDDFRRYIDFYNKNQVLRERFHPEYRFGFGAFNTQLVLDVTNGLFRLKDDESTIVFEKSALKSFRITEDKEPLFTGTAAGLVCAESKNPERVRLLAPRIEQFKLQRSDYERIMQAERVQYLDRTNEECFIPVTSPAPILTQLPAKEKRPAQRSGAGLHPARDCGMLDARKKGVRAKRAESGLHRPDL